MKPVKVADHCAQRNSRERDRTQQPGNDNRERRTQDNSKRRQSQIAEMTHIQVAAHYAQHNSRERGRDQQLGNDSCEKRTQYKAFRVASLNSTERALFNLQNSINQRTYQNIQNQSTAGIDPEFSAYISYLFQIYQKGFK